MGNSGSLRAEGLCPGKADASKLVYRSRSAPARDATTLRYGPTSARGQNTSEPGNCSPSPHQPISYVLVC